MPLVPDPKNCDISVKRAIQGLSKKLGYTGSPTHANITLTDLTASSLVGTNASKLLESVTVGTGLDYTRPNLTLSHLGIEALTDPGADRIIFWDDSATPSACKWLAVGNSIVITTTTVDTIQDIQTSASPTFAGLTLTNAAVIGSDSVVFQPATDSTTFFQVLDADGGIPVLNVDTTNERVGIGTTAPNAPLEVKGAKPGVVGSHQSGQLQVTGTGGEFYCAVITGHNSFNTNTQLWYLGSTSAATHDEIAFINRQNAAMHFYTNNTSRMTIDATGNVTLATIAAEESDVDKFLVSSSGVVKYRTGVQLLSDIGGQASDAGLTSLAGLVYASASFVKMTGANTFALRTIAETKTDLSLNLVENTALSTWAGTANITTLGTIATVGNITIPAGVTTTIGHAAGPLLTFNDTGNILTISGCTIVNVEGSGNLLNVTGNILTNPDTAASNFVSYGYGATAVARPTFQMINAKGTKETPLAVAENDALGALFFGGYDGTSYQYGGAIYGFVDGAVSAGSVPTRISFVTGTYSGDRTERVTIKSTGGLFLKEQAAASGDTAAYGQLWCKTATPNELWFTDDAGTDHQIAYV